MADIGMVERTLAVFCTGQVTELRALRVPGREAMCHVSGDLPTLARQAVGYSDAGAEGCYFVPNPLRVDLAGGRTSARKEDVLCRHWLLVDVDADRPDTPSNATEAELYAAWAVHSACRSVLDGAGLVNPVVGCSGNGWHLSYPINLPHNEASQALLKAILKGLQAHCGSVAAAAVDCKCHDAPRIWKLYGTVVRKGPESLERPHRLATLVEGVPWNEEAAGRNSTFLPLLLERWRFEEDLRKGRPTGDLISRAKNYIAKESPAIQGENGSGRCYHVAAILVEGFGLNREQAFLAMQDWNQTCRPPWSDAELWHKIDSALAKTDPAKRGLMGEASGSRASASAKTTPPIDPTSALIDRASDITPRIVQWLWPGIIPLGKLTTFAGIGGLGKTFVLCDITARVSTGAEWPHSLGDRAPVGQVLFISGEDDPEDTLVPRLLEMGADLRQVTFLKMAIQSRFTLADLAVLAAAIQQTGNAVRLVVIDPPTAYLGDVDDHKNAELRRLLAPLALLANQMQVAVIFNTHLNKAQGKIEAIMRVMGSVAWVNAVRAAHLFIRDPDNQDHRFFLPMKMNLARERKGLAFQITPSNQMARVDWLAEVDATADEAMNRKGGATPKEQDAEVFLRQLFEDRIEIPSDEVWIAAKAARISNNPLKDAKAVLGIKAAKKAFAGGGNLWVWCWPDDHPNRTTVQNG